MNKIYEIHYRAAHDGKIYKLGIFSDLESAKKYAEIYAEETLPLCLYVDEMHLGRKVYHSKRVHVKEIIYAGSEWEVRTPMMWQT